jgi:hypothetical protein
VENACYNINVRGTEVPKHMLKDYFTSDHNYDPVNMADNDDEE